MGGTEGVSDTGGVMVPLCTCEDACPPKSPLKSKYVYSKISIN